MMPRPSVKPRDHEPVAGLLKLICLGEYYLIPTLLPWPISYTPKIRRGFFFSFFYVFISDKSYCPSCHVKWSPSHCPTVLDDEPSRVPALMSWIRQPTGPPYPTVTYQPQWGLKLPKAVPSSWSRVFQPALAANPFPACVSTTAQVASHPRSTKQHQHINLSGATDDRDLVGVPLSVRTYRPDQVLPEGNTTFSCKRPAPNLKHKSTRSRELDLSLGIVANLRVSLNHRQPFRANRISQTL